MEPETHIRDLAELYAAGALDQPERSIVEAHIGGCTECLRRVGEAEETILALERRYEVRDDFQIVAKPLVLTRSLNRFWTIPAIAAALVIGFLIPHPQSHQDPAMLAMIQSHFSHAQFNGSGPPAKVLYARDRSWYYVIVQGRRSFDVYGLRAGRSMFFGSTQRNELTSGLFARPEQRFDAIELRENGRVVERASIR